MTPQSHMKHYKFWKFLLLKRYFEQGYGLTSYVKYLIFLMGIGEIIVNKSYKFVMILGILYGISCFIIGWAWYKFGLYETDTEISNRFNPFVKEIRNGEVKIFGRTNKRKIYK